MHFPLRGRYAVYYSAGSNSSLEDWFCPFFEVAHCKFAYTTNCNFFMQSKERKQFQCLNCRVGQDSFIFSKYY